LAYLGNFLLIVTLVHNYRHSPYFKPSHIAFRKAVRDFVEAEMMPFIYEWDEVSFRHFIVEELWERLDIHWLMPFNGKEQLDGDKI